MLSRFSHVGLFVTPWTVAHQAPLSMGFSRQENWSGLSCPPPGDLPDPGIEPEPLASLLRLAGGFLVNVPHVRAFAKCSEPQEGAVRHSRSSHSFTSALYFIWE